MTRFDIMWAGYSVQGGFKQASWSKFGFGGGMDVVWLGNIQLNVVGGSWPPCRVGGCNTGSHVLVGLVRFWAGVAVAELPRGDRRPPAAFWPACLAGCLAEPRPLFSATARPRAEVLAEPSQRRMTASCPRRALQQLWRALWRLFT